MSHIWTFSPSSEPLLNSVLEAASRTKCENKWTKTFGKTSNVSENNCITIESSGEVEMMETDTPIQENNSSITNEDFFETLENDPNFKFELILEEYRKNPDIITKMALNLSNNAIEKIFKHILNEKNVETHLMDSFFLTFYIEYVKNQYNVLCIELLIKINDLYPEIYLKLLKIIFNDTDIPSSLLNNYINLVKEEKLTKFLENLSKFDITPNGFIHNILTIYTAYKECNKNDAVQFFIKNCLLNFSSYCKLDKNYGRLFMLYLQNEKVMERSIDDKLVKCLQIHCSAFKKPCEKLLLELCDNIS